MHTTAFFEKSEVLVWLPKKVQEIEKKAVFRRPEEDQKKNRQNDEFFCEHEKLEKMRKRKKCLEVFLLTMCWL